MARFEISIGRFGFHPVSAQGAGVPGVAVGLVVSG